MILEKLVVIEQKAKKTFIFIQALERGCVAKPGEAKGLWTRTAILGTNIVILGTNTVIFWSSDGLLYSQI